MSLATIAGLALAAVGLLAMAEGGPRAFGARACLLGGLALAAYGTTL